MSMVVNVRDGDGKTCPSMLAVRPLSQAADHVDRARCRQAIKSNRQVEA